MTIKFLHDVSDNFQVCEAALEDEFRCHFHVKIVKNLKLKKKEFLI